MSEFLRDLVPLAVVSMAAWLTQTFLVMLVEAEVWRKITHKRAIKKVWWRQKFLQRPRLRPLDGVSASVEFELWKRKHFWPKPHLLDDANVGAGVLNMCEVKHSDADSRTPDIDAVGVRCFSCG